MMRTFKIESTLYPAVIVALGLASACDRQGEVSQPPQDQPVQVRVSHLSAGRIARAVLLPAQVNAFQEATLYAKVSGYLKSIAVDKGDKVAEGAVLARIEIPELVASKAKKEAEHKAAQADYRRLQESLQKAP